MLTNIDVFSEQHQRDLLLACPACRTLAGLLHDARVTLAHRSPGGQKVGTGGALGAVGPSALRHIERMTLQGLLAHCWCVSQCQDAVELGQQALCERSDKTNYEQG